MTRFCTTLVLASCLLTCAGRATGADPEEGKYYQIKCVRSMKVLSIENKDTGDGAKVIQVAPAAGPFQQWKFVKTGDYYKIVNRKTGKALNVKGGSKDEGTPVIQWDADDASENQQWSLVKKGEYFAIKARHSGLVLDVADGSKGRKVPLIQYPLQEKDNGNQIFELVVVKDKK